MRSTKYKIPIFNKTNKLKYIIKYIQLININKNPHTLTNQQKKHFITNQTINLQKKKNNNITLNKYIKIINHNNKNIISNHQTKKNIIKHSKQFPHLINYIKNFNIISKIKNQKKFHKLPNYKINISKITKKLLKIKYLKYQPKKQLHYQNLSINKNPYSNSIKKLPIIIHKHKPSTPFNHLHNKKY